MISIWRWSKQGADWWLACVVQFGLQLLWFVHLDGSQIFYFRNIYQLQFAITPGWIFRCKSLLVIFILDFNERKRATDQEWSNTTGCEMLLGHVTRVLWQPYLLQIGDGYFRTCLRALFPRPKPREQLYWHQFINFIGIWGYKIQLSFSIGTSPEWEKGCLALVPFTNISLLGTRYMKGTSAKQPFFHSAPVPNEHFVNRTRLYFFNNVFCI